MTITEFHWLGHHANFRDVLVEVEHGFTRKNVTLSKGLELRPLNRYGVTAKTRDRKGIRCLYRNEDLELIVKVPMDHLKVVYLESARKPKHLAGARKNKRLASIKNQSKFTQKFKGTPYAVRSGQTQRGLFYRFQDTRAAMERFAKGAEIKQAFMATVFGSKGNQPAVFYMLGKLISVGSTPAEPFEVMLRDDDYLVLLAPLRIEQYIPLKDDSKDPTLYVPTEHPIIRDQESWEDNMERR